MLKANTALRMVEIIQRVLDCENEHDEESIYWPEERKEWARVLKRAIAECKHES